MVPVYDILNCGPRNRFVVSGVLVHNCGYQGWVGAYESMAKNYAMKPLPEEQSKELILAWRESRPATTRLWREIEAASIMAVRNPGQICRYRLIQMLFHGDYLRVRLPSGRLLWYYHPIVKKSVTPWGQEKDMLWYMGEDSMTKQWKLISLYGGKAAENFVQGICRDLMAEAILRAEDQRYWVVMHVHDEIITEIPEGWGDLTYFENLMSTVPDWAVGLPIAAKGFRAKRYQKK
jgi:DNA polymerase